MDVDFFQKIKILIVEDSDNDRQLLVQTLSKYFKTILEAKDGEEAFEIYKQNSDINLIISDLNMPKMNGLELLKRVRLNDLYIPFIFTTAKSKSETILEAINLDATYYMLKPIDMKNLLQKIDLICEKLSFEFKLKNKQREVKNYLEAVDKVSLIFKMYEDGQLTYMNSSMQEVSGYTKEDIKNLNFSDIIHPSIPKKFITDTWRMVKDGDLWQGNTKFITKQKETFYLNNTVFKIEEENQYITIAFLTTQENLKKRDFQRKVLQNIQEANKKEYEYKKLIEQLRKKIDQQDTYIKTCSQQLEVQKQKAQSKERQLTHYELQMENTNAKYDKLFISKKEEIQSYIDKLETKKKKTDFLLAENYALKEELKIIKEKFANAEDHINKKNKRIDDLLTILNNKKKPTS